MKRSHRSKSYAEAKANGYCVRCKKRRAENDCVQCRRCLDALHYNRPRQQRATDGEWCDECLACGFHRDDCPTQQGAA